MKRSIYALIIIGFLGCSEDDGPYTWDESYFYGTYFQEDIIDDGFPPRPDTYIILSKDKMNTVEILDGAPRCSFSSEIIQWEKDRIVLLYSGSGTRAEFLLKHTTDPKSIIVTSPVSPVGQELWRYVPVALPAETAAAVLEVCP